MSEDIVRLNYGTHFREWYQQTLDATDPQTRRNPDWLQFFLPCSFAYTLLGEAQSFLLPEFGRVLTEDGTPKAKYAPLCYLPFPVTAFEFHVPIEAQEVGFALSASPSTRRIALCADAPTLNRELGQSFRTAPLADDEFGCMSVCYHDALRTWACFPHIYIISRSKLRIMQEDERKQSIEAIGRLVSLGLFKTGDFTAPTLGTQLMSLKSQPLGRFSRTQITSLQADTHAEAIAAIQACAALACTNIRKVTLAPSAVLNEKRRRASKEPFVSYHVLDLSTERAARTDSRGGSHAPPRQHLRRGHIRHLDPTRVTWVSSCVVGLKAHGKVIKDYRVAALSTNVGP